MTTHGPRRKMQNNHHPNLVLLGAELQNLLNCQCRSLGQVRRIPYHIYPSTAAELALARSARLKTKGLVERNQVVVGNDRNPVGNLGLADAVNIRLHQSATNLLALVLRQHCQ